MNQTFDSHPPALGSWGHQPQTLCQRGSTPLDSPSGVAPMNQTFLIPARPLVAGGTAPRPSARGEHPLWTPPSGAAPMNQAFLIPTRPPFGNWGHSPQTPLPEGDQPLWTSPLVMRCREPLSLVGDSRSVSGTPPDLSVHHGVAWGTPGDLRVVHHQADEERDQEGHDPHPVADLRAVHRTSPGRAPVEQLVA